VYSPFAFFMLFFFFALPHSSFGFAVAREKVAGIFVRI
jgi:hypothetical protein